jgi:hypothetical protein
VREREARVVWKERKRQREVWGAIAKRDMRTWVGKSMERNNQRERERKVIGARLRRETREIPQCEARLCVVVSVHLLRAGEQIARTGGENGLARRQTLLVVLQLTADCDKVR